MKICFLEEKKFFHEAIMKVMYFNVNNFIHKMLVKSAGRALFAKSKGN